MSQPQDAANYNSQVSQSHSIRQAAHAAAGTDATAIKNALVAHLQRVAALDHTYSRASGAWAQLRDLGVPIQALGGEA
jgi:hypothetical protein